MARETLLEKVSKGGGERKDEGREGDRKQTNLYLDVFWRLQVAL